MRRPGNPPRWRCAQPDCPWHRWQVVTVLGEYDPMDAALHELERHWQTKHKDKETKAT